MTAPKHGVTVRAHVDNTLERAAANLEMVTFQIFRKPRISKAIRADLTRMLAGVQADCETVKKWLDAGCPEG